MGIIDKRFPKQGKPMNVANHPSNTVPLMATRVNDPYSPPDPSASLQGPQLANAGDPAY